MKIKNRKQLNRIVESISKKRKLNEAALGQLKFSRLGNDWQMEDDVLIMPGIYKKIKFQEDDIVTSENIKKIGSYSTNEPKIGAIEVGIEDNDIDLIINMNDAYIVVNKEKIWKVK